MVKNRYIILNPLEKNSGTGGLVVLSADIGKTKVSISVFGSSEKEFEVLIDDLIFVRQFSMTHRIGQFELEKTLEDLGDVVVGLFNRNRELVFFGSTIGVETKEQKERLEIALENKYSIRHFGELARDVIVNGKKTFFDETVLVLLDLFSLGTPDSSLQKLVPHSRWVKIFLEKDVVAVGVVEKNGIVSAVGLAYPVFSKSQTRGEVDSCFSFLPINKLNPEGFGYYVVLQSAKDGSVVTMNAEKG